MTRACRLTAVPPEEVIGDAALLFPSDEWRANPEQSPRSRFAGRDDALVLARDLKHGTAMRGWNWDGWFVNIVNEQGNKIDELPIADA
jgi:hypothetical protein